MKGVNSHDAVNSDAHNNDARDQAQAIDITALYCQYYGRVFGWCVRMVRNTEDAEDLTQEAFIQIMRKVHTFRGEAALSTWLYRVVTSTVLMWLRKKRLAWVSLDEGPGTVEGSPWHGPAMGVVDSTLRDSIARIDLERAIHQLPVGFKAALVLHDVEDYLHSEVARKMGWSIGCSKSELYKARRRVRKMLSDGSEKAAVTSIASTGQKNLKRVARRCLGVRLSDTNDWKPGKGEHAS